MLPTNEAGFGMIELYRGRFGEAARRLGDAVSQIPVVGVDDTTVPDAWTMAVDPIASMFGLNSLARTWIGDVQGAVEQHEAARRRCAELPFPMGPFTEAYLLLVRSMGCLHLGDVDGARACSTEAHAISEQRGFDAWLFWSTILRTTYDAFTAEPEAAPGVVAQAATSADMLHAMSVRLFSAGMRSVLALAALETGDVAGALRLADDALRLAEETGTTMSVTEARRVRALAGPETGREAALVAALARAEAEGAVISAVRLATDLVRLDGRTHRTRLEAALAGVISDGDPVAPVLADARTLLAVL
jgi:hypothetical protein